MQRRLKPMGKRSKVHKSKMKFIKPNFYDAFHCTAAACSDTCCAGWEIDVDPDTVEYYENLEGELGDRLREELCDRTARCASASAKTSVARSSMTTTSASLS